VDRKQSNFEWSRERAAVALEGQIVGETCDGLEAVQKAAELRPDVVLDVGMPALNGIQIAEKSARPLSA
jgi:YesN/AraC family two-component response regulator